MSQRDSGYERKERDLYETPEWVTEALLPHLPRCPCTIWEPACGSGKMQDVLTAHFDTYGSDIAFGTDFLLYRSLPPEGVDAIITNPPYDLATEFIEHALRLMEPVGGLVAMLLRTDFDHAKSRSHLFRYCPAFAKKLVLTKRIKWFEGPVPCRPCDGSGVVNGNRCKACKGEGEKEQSPSENHSWFIWDWGHDGPPTIGYAP